jgi:II/X family phage/plasmid replication protein
MYDFWEIFIPFSKDFCALQRVGSGPADIIGIVDLEECSRRGLTLGSRRVSFAIDKEGQVHDLYHPWESIPSSFTDIAVKVHQSHLKRSWPGVTLKASPAKLLQGHNVYGPDSAAPGALELLAAFCRALPGVSEMLDWGNALVKRIDVTYSVQLPNEEVMANCLAAIGNLSHRHLRASKEADYESTIYFNKRTSDLPDAGRSVVRVVYAKHNETEHQLTMLRRSKSRERTSRYDRVIAALESPELQEFTQNRLRFEGRGLKRWFEQKGIPQNLWQLLAYIRDFETREGYSFCEWAWRDMFKDMFAALGDSKVTLTHDKTVHAKLREAYGKERIKEGKAVGMNYTRADRLMMFYRSLASEGWDKTKRLMATSTFYDAVSALLDVGLTKAQLQNASKKSRSRLLHLIKIDFDAQTPAGYVEPVGTVLDNDRDFSSIAAGLFSREFVQSVGLSRDQLIAQQVSRHIDNPGFDARAYVAHLVAGRPVRLNEGEQLHLAVFEDGQFELVRGDVGKWHLDNDIPVPESPPVDLDDPEIAHYLGAGRDFDLSVGDLSPAVDPRSAVIFTRRAAEDAEQQLALLRSRYSSYLDRGMENQPIAKSLYAEIQSSKALLNQLWHRHYVAQRQNSQPHQFKSMEFLKCPT